MNFAICFKKTILPLAVGLSLTAGVSGLSQADVVKLEGVAAQGGPTAQIFPIFMAQELGFYAKEGLEVKMNFSKGSSDAARQLAAGNVDFGTFSSAAVMQAVQRGFPLTAILQLYYPDAFDIVVPADSEIKSMVDLKGKTIGLSDLAGGEVPMTRASIVSSGLMEGADVKLVVAGEGDPTTVRSFTSNRIQAYSGAKRDILLIPAQGIPVRSITPVEIAAFPGEALSVRAETFKDKPELLTKFLRATIKGWVWGMANIDKTFDLLKSKYAAATLSDNPVALEYWKLVQTLYTTPDGVEYGMFVPPAWETYMKYLQLGEGEQKALAGPVDLTKVLDDTLVKEAWKDIDAAAVAKM